MTPAYGYLRVSGKGQIDGDGFPRQREAIRRYAAAHDIRIVKWFEERGESGTLEWGDRTAWSEMMTNLNGIRTIVIEKLDRLARHLMVQEHIIDDLKARNITLISTSEPDLGSDDPARVLFRQLMGAVAQYDRAMTVLKLRAARERAKKKEGRCEGRKPYGAKPGEAEILAHIRRLRESGRSFDQIAETLNQAGSVTRAGKQWIGPTIAKIVRRSPE